MSTEPNIHPPADTANDLLRDAMDEIRRLADRFSDNRVVVREKDKGTFRLLLDRYRVLQRQQGTRNLHDAQANSQE